MNLLFRVGLLLGFIFIAQVHGDERIIDAIRSGKKDLVQSLIYNGVNINSANQEGVTPLHVAVDLGDEKIIEMLLAVGANSNAKNYLGQTPLHLLANSSPIEPHNADRTIDLLCKHGAQINAQDANNATPLWDAASCGWTNIFKSLLDHHADPVLSGPNGETVVHAIIGIRDYHENQRLDILKLWVSRYKDLYLNSPDKNGNTPLHKAAEAGKAMLVKFLINEVHVNPIIANKENELPIHLAVIRGDLPTVKALLEADIGISGHRLKKSMIDAQNKEGNTPLILATWNQEKDIVEYLLSAGADYSIKNKVNQTAVDLSKLNSDIGIIFDNWFKAIKPTNKQKPSKI